VSFDRPLALIALIAIPALAVLWFLNERRRATAAGAFANPALVPNLVSAKPGYRRLLPLGLLLLAVAALVVGIARPHANVSVPRQEATVILDIDVSRSMSAQDVTPTRLDAAKRAADRFLTEIPSKYSVGVVGFGTRAFVALPPTTDRTLAHDALETLSPSEGTAIGDSIVLATRLAKQQKTADGVTPPASVLVISDGARDGGRISPVTAARRARAAHIPVSTVLVGTANGVVTAKLVGGYTEQIRVVPSPGTLTQIAQLTGGEFYRTRTSAALTAVYRKLATRVGHKTVRREITDFFAGGAILLLLTGGGLSSVWFRRLVP
jgi:Ca-activated chloride channel family protein